MRFVAGVLAAIAAMMMCCLALAQTPVPAVGVAMVGTTTCSPGTGLRCTDLSSYPYVLLGGWYSLGDGGGGYFAQGASGCTDNGGTILKDLKGNCFHRMDDRAAIPAKWFGAKCDAVTTVEGGSVNAGSTDFNSTSVAFRPGDVGKTIEFNAGTGNPFVTTIAAFVSSSEVTLAHQTYNAYPGVSSVKSATFLSPLDQGPDSAGTGYAPGDTLTIEGGSYVTGYQASATVIGTGLVNFLISNPGTGYAVGDQITFTAVDESTARPAVINVTQIGTGGAVQEFSWVDYGEFDTANPARFNIGTNGNGTGFNISLAPSNGSFGISRVKLTAGGSYNSPPPNPASTSDSGSGLGATVTLSLPTPSFTYGTDDTAALTAVEGYLENDVNRGIYNAAELPGGT